MDNGDTDYDAPIDPVAAMDRLAETGDMAKHLYSDPHFIWKGRLVESDFKVYVEREFNPFSVSTTTLFSMGVKQGIQRVVAALFDKNTPLSNVDSLPRCMLNLELAQLKTVLAMKEYDKNNPQWAIAQETIKNAYYHLITRAKGGRERELQNKLEQSLETTQRVIHTSPPQKRGFSIFGGNNK